MKRIIAYGTFDVLHYRHINLIKLNIKNYS